MKNKFNFLIVVCSFFVSFANAAEVKSGSSYEAGSNRFGLGLASVTTGAFGNSTMISGWIPLNSKMGIQPYVGIMGTTGNFNFLAGGAFKATVSGTGSTGLHIGGDFLLGSLNSAFVGIFGGLFGIHVSVHPNVMLQVDGGPQVTISGGNADFTMQSVSGLLGASLVYFL